MTGTIFDIKEMAVHDGPGIRTTVFFKGCPLRCSWCHNPEGFLLRPQLMYKKAKCIQCKSCEKECEHPECEGFGKCILSCPQNCLEIAGRKILAKNLAKELSESADILGSSFGGFTFSGGEPLFQPEFLSELMHLLEGYHLAIETSGYAEEEVFKKTIEGLDYIIMDIKLADSELHKSFTGKGNEKILNNLSILKESQKPHLIRTPLIPGITDTEDNLSKIEGLIGESPWEKIPYNKMAGAKYEMLGMEYGLKGL